MFVTDYPYGSTCSDNTSPRLRGVGLTKHIPEESNPDQEVWKLLCCHYTRDISYVAEVRFELTIFSL